MHRESYGCLRGSFVLDGDMVDEVLGTTGHEGQLVDMCPILSFSRFEENRHTGAALARWKRKEFKAWGLEQAFGLATEDGASNNKAANRILGLPAIVCGPHDIARAVLFASGETGTPTQNSECKAFIARSSTQSAAFSRSVVANKDLQDAQQSANPQLKEHQIMQPKTKNLTRWLGLFEMTNRNRLIGPEMRMALTGSKDGVCEEEPALPAFPVGRMLGGTGAADADSSSDEDDQDGVESDGADQEEGNRVAGKNFPLAHRCLPMSDVRNNELFESVLDRPREVTLQMQDESMGEGMDLGVSWLMVREMRDEAVADRLEAVSGRKETETWKEVNAASLPPMFRTFRKILALQLCKRFDLDTTPNPHVQLALRLNPSVNTDAGSELLAGKSAMYELMEGTYVRALRRQAILLKQKVEQSRNTTAPTPAPAPRATPDGPVAKKRRSLLGSVAAHQALAGPLPDSETSQIDMLVKKEIDSFNIISQSVLAQARASPTPPSPFTMLTLPCVCVCD